MKPSSYIYIVCEPLSDGKVRPLQSFTSFQFAVEYMEDLMAQYDKEPQLAYIIVRQKVKYNVKFVARED